MRRFSPWAAVLLVSARLAADPAAGPILYPHGAGAPASAAPGSPGWSSLASVLGAILAAAGGWLIWSRYRGREAWAGRSDRLLSVSETRPLGNRQYLVVAAYGRRRFLLGVCPTRIELLSPLDDSTPPAP
jgi:flagellar protein FliO/FliZ